MFDHIDLFEKIYGQIASSGLPATEEEKLDWFLESVHEDTYHAIKAHCNSLKILGTLQFAQMIKLYALTCFAKYPHFQLRALGHKDATLTNNSATFKGRKGQRRSEGSKGKGRGPTPKGKRRGGRSKGKGSRSATGKARKRVEHAHRGDSNSQAQVRIPTRQSERKDLPETYLSLPRRMQLLWHLWPPVS
jgi:hypothetical protein